MSIGGARGGLEPPCHGHSDGAKARRRIGAFARAWLQSTSAVALVAIVPSLAAAQNWTGNTNSDWTVGSNWSGGTVPTAGLVSIIRTSPNPVVLGVSGAANGTTGNISVGSGGTGSLTIQNGSTLTTSATAYTFIGQGTGASGIVNVTGAGSRWTINGAPGGVSLLLGENRAAPGATPVPTGILNISDGGAVQTAGDIVVGEMSGSGILSVTSGGRLTTGRDAYIGRLAGSNGTATITGSGSLWSIADELYVGNGGPGALTISDNATVDVATTTYVADLGSPGTLNITSGGTLVTRSLQRSTGAAAQVNFDGGTLRAKASNATFISNFSGTQLNLAAGGLTLDTVGFNVTAASPFSGIGGLTKIGSGILTLTAGNSFTGATWIQSGTLALSGAGSVASSSKVIADGTFDITGVTGAGSSIKSLGGGGTVNLGTKTLEISAAQDTFSGTFSGTGGLTITGGIQNLTGNNATFTGPITVAGGTLAVNNTLCGPMSVLAGGRLQGTGTVCDTTNTGTIAPGNSIGTLTIAGNYTGNGGTLEIEAVLGGDASPTDRLVVSGDTFGATNVRVINLGGAGAQTVEGIKIVDVGGASNGTFSLLGDFVFQGEQAVVGGAYAYRLYQGGVSTPGDGDWYLRSVMIDPVTAVAAPLWQPGVPLYEAYAGVLQAFNQPGTLQQRLGNRAWADGAREGTGLWARIDASRSRFEPKSSTTGTTYDASIWRLEAGIDAQLAEQPGGRLMGGLSLQYGTISSDVASLFGRGSIDTSGFGLGASLTWYGDDGFYVDGQTRVTWYDSDLKSSTAARKLADGNGGVGYGLSVEAGQRIALGGGFSLTPQAQLAYSAVRFDDFTDAFGTLVRLDDGDGLWGRLGLSADYNGSWQDAAGRLNRAHVYAIANLYYDFAAGTRVAVAELPFTSENEALWGGVGLGGSLNFAGDRYALYGEALVRTGLDNFGDSHVLSGSVGFRARW